jgi:hypothetical protein
MMRAQDVTVEFFERQSLFCEFFLAIPPGTLGSSSSTIPEFIH